jgi:hypothetical protein
MSRPTKLTPQLQELLVEQIKKGNYIETACGVVGINKQSYYNWLGRGKKAKSGKFFDFFDAIKKAEDFAEAYLLQQILSAADNQEKPQWQAAAWMLERKHPDKWGRKERLDVRGEFKEDVTVNSKVAKIGRLFKLAEEANEEEDDGVDEG